VRLTYWRGHCADAKRGNAGTAVQRSLLVRC
jgi:hypothetical protein